MSGIILRPESWDFGQILGFWGMLLGSDIVTRSTVEQFVYTHTHTHTHTILTPALCLRRGFCGFFRFLCSKIKFDTDFDKNIQLFVRFLLFEESWHFWPKCPFLDKIEKLSNYSIFVGFLWNLVEIMFIMSQLWLAFWVRVHG